MKKLLIFTLISLYSLTTHAGQELTTYEEVLKLMDQHYFDSNYNNLDWPKLTAKARDKIKAAKSSIDKYQTITDLLKTLGHSHLEFHPPGIKASKGPRIPSGTPKEINFQIEQIDNQWVITSVKEKSNAWQAGLRPGFIVKKLNQWSTKTLFNDKKAMAFYYMQMTLENYPKTKITLSGLNEQGQKSKITWTLPPFKGTIERLGNLSKRTEVISKVLPGNIGYVSFNIYLIGPAQQTIKAIKKFRDLDCTGIIIDLRNNPGGVATMSCAIAKELCQKNYNLGTQTGRESILTFPVYAQPKPYKGKVVLLLNKYSASTSEVMAAGIQANKGATVIGETSAGMALPSVIVNFDDGSVLQYPVADFKTVNGKDVEGIGVTPDIKISHTLDALKKGRDLFLEEAIRVLRQ
jgi:C-terminal peptidase prc